MPLTATSPLEKHPDEVDRLAFNFGNRFAPGSSETISTANIPAVSGITIASVSVDGYRVRFTVSGGTAGVDYEIECTATTSTGRTLVGCGTLQVRECS